MASTSSFLEAIRPSHSSHRSSSHDPPLLQRLLTVFLATFDLGFTSFGGPAVHFQIFRRRFVEGISTRSRLLPRSFNRPRPTNVTPDPNNPNASKSNVNPLLKWIDQQIYSELFAICQALPGPGSTKMLTAIAGLHAGWIAGLFVFLLWSLPGALAMFALSLGVRRIDEVLPGIVYALLSGLNASTVGIVALAAVQLAEKAVVDKLSRILVVFGACAGLCYNALWFFPVLVIAGGIAAGVWDCWLRQKIDKAKATRRWRKEEQRRVEEAQAEEATQSIEMTSKTQAAEAGQEGLQRRPNPSSTAAGPSTSPNSPPTPKSTPSASPPSPQTQPEAFNMTRHSISIPTGIGLIFFSLALLLALLLSRSIMPSPPPRSLDLFANMYLAGTIIFGGGPVVIPLLREYTVQPGWVSSRDFLIGLAIIQAMPGPNFNFGVYLGSLALTDAGNSAPLGALLGYLGIFMPGITVQLGVMGLWRVLRTKSLVIAVLRGINATAVGLVFTAVYRLWEIGYLTPEDSQGRSLADEPWWVVVAAVTYAESKWFGVPPAAGILGGGLLGLVWYGATGQ